MEGDSGGKEPEQAGMEMDSEVNCSSEVDEPNVARLWGTARRQRPRTALGNKESMAGAANPYRLLVSCL
jgi:hypothetical protein